MFSNGNNNNNKINNNNNNNYNNNNNNNELNTDLNNVNSTGCPPEDKTNNETLVVKLETTHKPPVNHPKHPQIIHKPGKKQLQISQTTHKSAKPPTNQSNNPQTIHKPAKTTTK